MDHNLLVSELQSLVVESKRRHPDVKDAGERALDILKGGPLPRDSLSQHSEELLSPITLGCKTKTAKIIGVSISALQRLVSLGGVVTSSLPGVLQTLNSVSNQAVEIQLKILQTLLSILTFNRDIHDEILGSVLLLCFKLQESRVSVVSSTAAATLRQAVMLIFDRSNTDQAIPSIPLSIPTEPTTELTITPSAMDAYGIFSDLCLLTGGGGVSSGMSLWGGGDKEKPRLLKLHGLQRTFGLELIESILSGYEDGVKQRPELLFLLSHSLDPLLLKLLAEKPSFSIALRVCRLIFLLVRSFTEQLPLQVEVYLSALIRMGMGENEGEEAGKKDSPATWLRVLALEILRGICGDGVLIQNIYNHFDAKENGSKMYQRIISSLGKLLNEKPILLGVGSQMNGLGVPTTEPTTKDSGYLDMGIGMMASAASVGISTVGTMIGSNGSGLGQHSSLKLRLIEQHDKAEAPIIPDTYIYLLALQSIDAVSECVYLSATQGTEEQHTTTRGMAESAWPALLAALSFSIGTNLSDSLFAEVLSALQDFTVACGLLSLVTPRNAFIRTLGKYAVPPPVVSAMQSYMEAPQAPRNNSVISVDSLGLGALGVGGVATPPSLSERNLACLRACVTTARILAGSLGEAWYDVLEILQNVNFMLAAKKPSMARRPTAASPQIGSSPSKGGPSSETNDNRPGVFGDLDLDSIHSAINLLFDGTRDMDDASFSTFITALCRLSAEMIGMDANNSFIVDLSDSQTPISPPASLSAAFLDTHRRRTSGINISHGIKSGERSFSLTKLRVVSLLNLARIVSSDPSSEWQTITQHLLAVARHPTAPTTIRMQASDTLSELLLSAIRIGKELRTQHHVFDVLVRQVDVQPVSHIVSTDYDVRSSGYQTLNQILESSGHSLEVGWQTIFGILNGVTRESPSAPAALRRSDSQLSIASTSRPSTFSKGDANLVRITFPSLNLICTDFLSSLDKDAMRQCISCLGCFGRQKEDVNITLAAIGLLWAVSDAVQGEHKDLWLYLLLELLELGRDPRLEVRSSAMQTLFRCVELYGANLDAALWEDVLWKVVLPLLDSASNDESAVLALSSTGSILGSFIKPISNLPSFDKVYDRFLIRVKRAWETEPRQCCTAALKSMERVLSTLRTLPQASELVLTETWRAFIDMSASIPSCGPYTQDNLIAHVRIASLLHDQVAWSEEKSRSLSSVLRTVMTYDKSPEYRPDVDSMSPLQSAVLTLLAGSTKLSSSLVLSDLAEYGSLAYVGDSGSMEVKGGHGRLTFVGVSKFVMPKMAEVLKGNSNQSIYQDGTVERVIGTYSIPIKLKYDCPSASKFGDDQPLWRTAMTTFLPVLNNVMEHTDKHDLSSDRSDGIWAQIIDVFSGLLLADNASTTEEDEAFVQPHLDAVESAILPRLARPTTSDSIISQFAEILRKASRLYRFDGPVNGGGTTAPSITESSESMRYWAFDVLISAVARNETVVEKIEDKKRVAGIVLQSLMVRFEDGLRRFLEDSKIRGQLPFGRIREEELLYILRNLITLDLWPGTLQSTPQGSQILAVARDTSTRAHLFHLYPLLLELSFVRASLPSMWIFPSEQAKLFDLRLPEAAEGAVEEENELDAGDGGDLIEVGARDLARRCLELVGLELGLS